MCHSPARTPPLSPLCSPPAAHWRTSPITPVSGFLQRRALDIPKNSVTLCTVLFKLVLRDEEGKTYVVLSYTLWVTSLPCARGFFFAFCLRSDGKVEEGKAWRGMSRGKWWVRPPCSGRCGALRMKFLSATRGPLTWCSSASVRVGYL